MKDKMELFNLLLNRVREIMDGSFDKDEKLKAILCPSCLDKGAIGNQYLSLTDYKVTL